MGPFVKFGLCIDFLIISLFIVFIQFSPMMMSPNWCKFVLKICLCTCAHTHAVHDLAHLFNFYNFTVLE